MSDEKQKVLTNLEVMASNCQDAMDYLTYLQSSFPEYPWETIINQYSQVLTSLDLTLQEISFADSDIADNDTLLGHQLHVAISEVLSTALGRAVPFHFDLRVKPKETIH